MVHPIVEAYICKGWFRSVVKTWRKQFGIKLQVESNSSMELLEFRLFNQLGEELAA
jgi:ribonuclease G